MSRRFCRLIESERFGQILLQVKRQGQAPTITLTADIVDSFDPISYTMPVNAWACPYTALEEFKVEEAEKICEGLKAEIEKRFNPT